MTEGCLICGEELEYLNEAVSMECEICHKKVPGKTRCKNGHFVCDACHSSGVDQIFSLCLCETEKNPLHILEKMMSMDFCHMHGPEHHVMVGSSLLTAYKNAGGDIDLMEALKKMYQRGSEVPGGICGFWGSCGAGISTGIYISIVTGSTPLEKDPWKYSNRMTASALGTISRHGGPRCCKRDSYLAVKEAIRFTKEVLNVELEDSPVQCTRSKINQQCLGKECPFFRHAES